MSKTISGIITNNIIINGDNVLGYQLINANSNDTFDDSGIIYVPTASASRTLTLPKINYIGIEKKIIFQSYVEEYPTIIEINNADTINGGSSYALTTSDVIYYLYSTSLTTWIITLL